MNRKPIATLFNLLLVNIRTSCSHGSGIPQLFEVIYCSPFWETLFCFQVRHITQSYIHTIFLNKNQPLTKIVVLVRGCYISMIIPIIDGLTRSQLDIGREHLSLILFRLIICKIREHQC